MLLNAQEKHEFWTKAFLAAIAGFSSKDNQTDSNIADRAAGTADEALKVYLQRSTRM